MKIPFKTKAEIHAKISKDILKVVDRLASDMVSLTLQYGTETGYIDLLLDPTLDKTREEAKHKIKNMLSGEYDNK